MPLTRRHFVLSALACGALASAAGVARADGRAAVKVALDWTPNTNHIGLYVAQGKGFYADAGLDVTILPYADTSPGTLIANGIADFGVIGSLGLFTQRAAGAPLVAVYGVVQHETGRLVFDAGRKDITRPRDLDGKKYGGFGTDWENALIGTMIRNDGGKGQFETITLGTSAYEALANGAVDFTLEVVTWEGVEARLKGLKQRELRYADYGVPDQQTTLIGSSQAYLAAHPEIASAFVRATRRGYGYAADNPDEASDMLVGANRDFPIDRALVGASMQALIGGHYLRAADGTIGAIDAGKFKAMGAFLFANRILKDGKGRPLAAAPDFSGYYANRYWRSEG